MLKFIYILLPETHNRYLCDNMTIPEQHLDIFRFVHL
jgi:hypothetical protein